MSWRGVDEEHGGAWLHVDWLGFASERGVTVELSEKKGANDERGAR